MNKQQLTKIFEEISADFLSTPKAQEIIKNNLSQAGKYSKDMVLLNTAFELSQHFMYEVMQKVCADDSPDNQQNL